MHCGLDFWDVWQVWWWTSDGLRHSSQSKACYISCSHWALDFSEKQSREVDLSETLKSLKLLGLNKSEYFF